MHRRRALEQDRQFLEDVHIRALGAIALVGYGWVAERLRAQFHAEIQLAACEVIVVDGASAGYVSIHQRPDHWYIDAFAIAPRFQRRGLGGMVLDDLLAGAPGPVRLNVLHVNPARVLYERVGFRVLHRDARRSLMEWRPQRAAG